MLPISFKFVAASVANQAKGVLYKFTPERIGSSPSWEKNGTTMQTEAVPAPYTDKSYWEDRYALCLLTFKREDGEQLVVSDAIAAVGKSKNIVRTQLVGMDGTVKEYINDGDYSINLLVGVQAVENGVMVDKYPSEGITQLRSFFDVKTPVYVFSEFLSLFDIDKVVVTGFTVRQATESNYQPIEISLLSDTDYNVFSTAYK